MTREIALLTNPTAGKGRARRVRDAALPLLHGAGWRIRSLEGRDADEATDLARQAVADGVEALVVCGGDGLVHLALQAVGGTDVPLGILPAGTGNDAARSVGIPLRDPAGAAGRLLGMGAASDRPGAGPATAGSWPCSLPGSTRSSTSAPTR